MKFIQLTHDEVPHIGQAIIVNPDHIICMSNASSDIEESGSLIALAGKPECIEVQESPNEILNLILNTKDF